MASTQISIELQDQFSQVLYGIVSSVNLAVSAAYDMQQAMSVNIDTSALQTAQEEINQAAAALNGLNEALNSQMSVAAPPVENVPAPPQPQPVEIPVVWQTDNFTVFTDTGIARFEQELQSANQAMQQLCNTQDAIAKNAYENMIFPPEAFRNLNSMAVRMDAIQQQIRNMENSQVSIGTDAANSQLEHLRALLYQAEQRQNDLNTAMKNMDISAANSAYLKLSQTISGTERYIRDGVTTQEQLNSSVRQCGEDANKAGNGFSVISKAIKAANQAVSFISNTLGQLGITDLSGAFDQIDTMAQFQRNISNITGDSAAANAALAQLKNTTTGTAYGLDVAGKATQGFLTRGMSLGAATDQVRIWADAVSFYGEGTNAQLESVVDAVGQMYSKGTVEADQLDRIFDAGIGAAELYADTMGLSVSQVRDDLSNGSISAAQFIQTVSSALDNGISNGAAKNAGDTWAGTFANAQASVTRGWTDVITQLDASLASHGLPSAMEMVTMFSQGVESALGHVGDAMDIIIGMAMKIYEVMAAVGGFIADNWSIITPIVMGVVGAMAAYVIVGGIVAAINGVNALATNIKAAAEMRAARKTFSYTAAQQGLNATLFACPITWIVLAVIALIVAIAAVCAWIAKTKGAAQSGFGVFCGAINVALQFVKNLALTIANFVLGVNLAISALGFNIRTAFKNAILSAISWWYDLLSTSLTTVAAICAALNKLPFVEFDYSGIIAAADKYAAKSLEVTESKQDYASISDAFNTGMSVFDTFQDGWVQNAFDAGAAWGDGIAEKVSGFNLAELFGGEENPANENNPAADEYAEILNNLGITDNSEAIANNTGDLKDSVDISQEDLRYLRDLAEQETVNRFTTAEIVIDMGGVTNNMSANTDLDGFMSDLTNSVLEAVQISTEGAHL